MKRSVTLTIFAAIVTLLVYSYSEGPAFWGGIDGTGAKGGGGCNNGSCHTASNTNSTIVELDSAGIPVASYHPGMAYTVKVSASNSSANNWPKFGFQMAVVKLAGAGTSSPVDAGTWGTLPSNVQKTVLTESIIEHNQQIPATTGTGGMGTTYVESIPWTAPVAGTGSVVIYGVINAINFDRTDLGDGYQVANHITITEVAVPVVASVSIAITSGSNPTCANNSLTFAATPVNGGTAPTYQWLVNGNNAGTGATFTTSALNNGQVVTCVMTSNLAGVTSNPATSNAITVTVNAVQLPLVSIESSDTTICPNESVTFTATPINGGSSPTYQWKKNGTAINGATSSTYTATTLVNGDVITVAMTSNATCATPATVTSSPITMVVSATVVPSVSISSSDTTICSNQSVTFAASPTNGGNAPTYQWKRNGSAIGGATSAIFTTSTLINGDVITVAMVSNANCAAPTSVNSSAITMVVVGALIPSVNISSTAINICPNQVVTFTATPTNGGNSPGYQWKLNGNVIFGADSSTHSSSTLSNNDVITVVMTSNANCASPVSATSNSITMAVASTVVPSVSIVSSDTTICPNQSVIFTATPGNGGSSPTYQWKKNGSSIGGATSSTYNTTTLVNGDAITVAMKSNATCATPANITSGAITMVVGTTVVPSVSISCSDTAICPNQSVTFTSNSNNGGITPSYQWRKNGNVINGANSSTYISNVLANNDAITLIMVSDANCASPVSVSSSAITMMVGTVVVPSVNISATAVSICPNESIAFTATATNGGPSPTYQWKKNGIAINGATTSTYNSSSLANADVITVVMTSNANCALPAITTSNSITIAVGTTVVPNVSIAVNDSIICANQSVTFSATVTNGGGAPTYQWQKGGVAISGAISSDYTSASPADGDIISVVVTSNANCASPSTAFSNAITLHVTAMVAPSVTIGATGGSNICLNQSTILTATPTGGGINPSYQWYKDGAAIGGASGSTYVTSTLANNDIITCVLTSSASCLQQTTAASNAITFSVTGSVTPLISIFASEGSANCAGQPVTITSLASGGGNAPVYKWFLDNMLVNGASQSTFTSSTFANNDSIKCVLISNAGCATIPSDTSNSVTLIITPAVTPTISLSSSGNLTCSGTEVTFTAASTNSGNTPTYKFLVNGFSVQNSVSATYSSSALQNGDLVTCILTSNALCANPINATSAGINMTVKAVAASSITQVICQGDTFLGRTVTGTYHDTASGSNGCDSIRTLNLTVNPITSSVLNQTICGGQSFLGYHTTGIFNDTLQGYLGCDSIRTLNLIVNNISNSNIFNSICSGTSYLGYDSTGVYIDTLISSNGCDSIRTLDLTVISASSSSISVTACNSYSSPSGHYVWTFSGIYADTVISTAGCDSVITVALTIQQINDTASVDQNVCIAARAGANYQWIDCTDMRAIAGSTSQVFTALVNGDYACIIYVGNCIDTTNCVSVNSIGLDNIESTNFKLYPNPNSGKFDIQLDYSGIVTIQIFDMIGKKVGEYNFIDKVGQFDISDLAPGIYEVKIAEGKQLQKTIKVVKE